MWPSLLTALVLLILAIPIASASMGLPGVMKAPGINLTAMPVATDHSLINNYTHANTANGNVAYTDRHRRCSDMTATLLDSAYLGITAYGDAAANSPPSTDNPANLAFMKNDSASKTGSGNTMYPYYSDSGPGTPPAAAPPAIVATLDYGSTPYHMIE